MNNTQKNNTKPAVSIDSSRRQAIKQISVLFAGALSANSIAHAIGYKAQYKPDESAGLLLNQKQLRQLKCLVDLILPETDTPAASRLDVHGFIDDQLFHCYSTAEQNVFILGLTNLSQVTSINFNKGFTALPSAVQIKLLTEMSAGQGHFNSIDKDFFYQLKTLTLLGYYTSEVGATQVLSYLAIPGGYQGDFPFSSIGKAWAF